MAHRRITVSQLRCAVVDARWRQDWLGGKSPTTFLVPANGQPNVHGIRFHPQHDLEVVDYKLTQGSQQKSDFIQLAIYAHLLPLWRPGCRFCGTVEYYLPEFMEVPVSAEELADIYRGLVEPVLREMFDTAKHGSAKPAGSDRRDVAKRVVDAFKAFGLSVEAGDVVEGPQVTRVKVRPAAGVKVASLANRAEDLQVSLALDELPLVKPGRGFVIIDLPRHNRETVLLLDALDRGIMNDSASSMAFPVGVGVEGEPSLSDFADSNTCHILVAGVSRSG